MRNHLLLLIVFFTTPSFATTITVFSEGNRQCRYVLADDNAKPLATWTGDCLENLADGKTIDIADGTPLWKVLKKLDQNLSLQNITVIIPTDEYAIAKLKSLSVTEIEVTKPELKKSIKINIDANNNLEKQEAQDYNSSRSNKANSISTAQDYNSSRSNKANSIATVNLNNSDSAAGNKINTISTAQDYNSSRSNKANSISTAQDYNSSRSNKANSIYTTQDYNSSRSNKSGIILSAGIALPYKNSYMKNGLVFNFDYRIPLKNNFGIETGISISSNSFSYIPSSLLPGEYKNAIEESINSNRWSNLTFSVGPSLMIGKGKCNATIYAKAAALFTKIPHQTIGNDNPVAVFDGNKTSFAFNPGLRFNYSMNSKLSLFVNPELLTSLNKNILYQEKDISKATNADGKFNPDTYNSLPLDKKYVGINLFGVSAGLKINL